MSTWLYQLSETEWAPGQFRNEVWESKSWRWGYGKKSGGPAVEIGDTLIFYYAPTGCSDYGFYGWAIVESHVEKDSLIHFKAAAPTDHLKMDPWRGDGVKALATKIRGKVPMGTLFEIQDDELASIRQGIKSWLFQDRSR